QSQNFSEQVYPGVDAPYRDNVPREQIAGEDGWWAVVRDEKLDDPALQRSPLFYGSERVETESEYDFPRWLGYTLSYHIGSQLLGEDDIGIEDFPHLSRDDVVRAGDALYG
ncbi:MAG: hypothetical protein SVU88_04565, partial [Candidatus Nanohaloarchaea archaeon]|nr:hypothetical protein [Candidatus Nanohaloarchaea archaeon]